MLDEEKEWHMKIRVTWVEVRRLNTKYFHFFSNYRRVKNFVWVLQLDNGNAFRTFRELADLGVSHFENIYSQPNPCMIDDIMQLLSKYTKLVIEDDNDGLFKEITLEELKVVV